MANFTNNSSNTTISGTSNADTIRNNSGGSRVLITAGAGNDSIYNAAQRVTVDAGDGNDTINNSNSYVSISAGSGDDSIYSYYGFGNDYTTIIVAQAMTLFPALTVLQRLVQERGMIS